MRSLLFLFIALLVPAGVSAQVVGDASDAGTLEGRRYTNAGLGFEIAFPDAWIMPDGQLEEMLRSKGIDTSLKAPETIGKVGQIQLERSLENVKVLLTVYRSAPGTANNAILRISTEDIRANPAIGDAVDYFDLMRAQFAVLKLPADLKYSETQAEQLGSQQFAFLDIETAAGKKRMYATVRHGVALMFTLSYTKPDDLKVFRDILAKGNFRYGK